jgi:hypothetical protein
MNGQSLHMLSYCCEQFRSVIIDFGSHFLLAQSVTLRTLPYVTKNFDKT